MNSEVYNNFINTLSAATAAENKYISYNGHQYVVSDEKGKKTLNTETIASLAEKFYLDLKKENKSCSYQTRSKRFSTLTNALELYTARLYNSKAWYQKIASFFGFKSDQEQRIDQVVSLSSSAKRKAAAYDKAIHDIEYQTNLLETIRNVKLGHFYHSVLDSVENLEIEALDGADPLGTLQWQIDHLKAFYNEMTYDAYTIAEKQAIQSLIDSFEFTKSLESAIHLLTKGMVEIRRGNTANAKFYTTCKKNIIRLILERKANLKAGERMCFPGGFVGVPAKDEDGKTIIKGRAALNILEKATEGDIHSFETINTGDGSSLAQPIRDVARNLFNIAKTAIIGGSQNQRYTTTDDKYEKIPSSKLDFKFFDKLIEFLTSGNAKDMDEVSQHIAKSFADVSKRTDGRKHKVQKKGSCAHKHLSAGSKRILGDTLYLKFKVWMTNREIKNFSSNKLGTRLSSELAQEILSCLTRF